MADQSQVSFEDRVRRAVAAGVPMEVEKVDLDRSFSDLGLESLDVVNILFALETEFGIEIDVSDFDTNGAGTEHKPMRELVEVTRRIIAQPKAD